MTDDRLDAEVRALLARRDPGPGSAALHDAVLAIPAAVRRPSVIRKFGRQLMPVAAGLAAVAVLVSIGAVAWLGRSTTGPGASGGPAPSGGPVPFDPTADGAGLMAPPTDLLVPVAVIACLVLALSVTLRPTSVRVRAVVTVVIAVLMWAGFWLRSGSFVSYAGGDAASGLGYVSRDNDVASGTQMYAVAPNGVLTFGFDVTNTSPLPIDIIGVTADTDGGTWTLGEGPTSSSVKTGSLRVTAAGLLSDPNTSSLEPSATRPFERVRVESEERAFVIVAARGGRCALGRSNVNDAEQSNDTLQQVGVVYEALGVRSMAIVKMPYLVVVPLIADPSCDPTG
jgi:hypothetical protein